MAILIVQGYKRALIGDYEANYGENQCAVIGIDMPGIFHIASASPSVPFLSISLKLDRQIISQLISEMPSIITENINSLNPLSISDVQEEIIDAFSRLINLLDFPSRIPVLSPLIIREIHYYLLVGCHGDCLRLFNTTGTYAGQVAQAIRWLRENYAKPLRMEELAQEANLAPSTFNRHFRQVTSLSPLQFQKRLRLYEAERLLLHEGKDVKSVARMVGYESVSQFSREYKRQFGDPPRKDLAKKREQ